MPRKQPRKVNARSLERSAMAYLNRYDTSSQNLRDVLMRRVDRSVRFHGGERSDYTEMVDALVTRFVDAGVVDDARYARGKAGSLHRRGTSSRVIRMKLQAKGIPEPLIREALRSLEPEGVDVDPDLVATITWARRRRVGPFRQDLSLRREKRQKDLAVLARRGFPFGLCRQVIDAEDTVELLEILAEAEAM